MVQIVKRKKKCRPTKSDLTNRRSKKSSSEGKFWRSLRPRNATYNIDYDEDDEDEEEDERRREKKLKLVAKITNDRVDCESTRHDDVIENEEDEGDEEREAKGELKGQVSVPESQAGVPLPNKKLLELILDKLQKKDVYGVYAEPVDPEELPDYHDIIEHPMDFATVRKKLGNGAYCTLEQFENDVFLICSNAMQYNAPDTIYHKQARTIQELARKKFQKVRIKFNTEPSEKELKSEQKTRSNSSPEKQIKVSVLQASHEPVGLDILSVSTLATPGNVQNGLNPTQAGRCRKLTTIDEVLESKTFMTDNNGEKVEDLLGNAVLSKFGRNVRDENCRTTYNLSNQPAARSESIYMTFESEHKLLVSVGLHAEYSYVRSLARFAGTLGPVAWKVASKRLEQALPVGLKFGRGWVGEYEPLRTPVLILENRSFKEPAFLSKFHKPANLEKDCRTFDTLVPSSYDFNTPVPVKEYPANGPTSEGKWPFLGSVSGPIVEGKSSLFGSAGNRLTTLNSHSVAGDKMVLKKNELNFLSTSHSNKPVFLAQNQLFDNSEGMVTSYSMKTMDILQPIPFKLTDLNGGSRLPHGEVITNSLDSDRLAGSSSDSVSNPMARPATYFPYGQEQCLSNPVQLMGALAEKARNQQQSPYHTPVDSSSVMPSIPCSTKTDLKSTHQATTDAWISIGAEGFDKQTTEILSPRRNHISADSFYYPARELHPQVSRFHGETPVSGGLQFLPEKNNFSVQAFVPQHFRMANEAKVQNRPSAFTQLFTADLSRFQMSSPQQGLNPLAQLNHKQTLPPDLNIDFQSSESPVRQCSGILVDSQQPDSALQL